MAASDSLESVKKSYWETVELQFSDGASLQVRLDQPTIRRLNEGDQDLMEKIRKTAIGAGLELVREPGTDQSEPQLSDQSVNDQTVNEAEYQEAASKSNMAACFSKEQTKCLISLYKENQTKFEDTTIKKKVVWEEVTETLNQMCSTQYVPKQVEGRWKTIICMYRKHKDQNKSSGSGRKDYEFEKDLDEIMLKNHDTSPKFTLASTQKDDSSSPESSTSVEEPSCSTEENEGELPSTKRRKTSRTVSQSVFDYLSTYTVHERERESRREQQLQNMHQEKMSLFREFLDVFKSKKD